MRSKKNGDKPRPKIAWEMTAAAHIHAAEQLQDLIERFNLDSSTELGRAVIDARIEEQRAARDCVTEMQEIRVGRPCKKVKKVGIIAGAMRSETRKIGRPRIRTERWKRAMYVGIESRREQLKDHGVNNASVTDAIKSFLEDRIAPLKGWSKIRTVSTYKAMTRAAYYAGKERIGK